MLNSERIKVNHPIFFVALLLFSLSGIFSLVGCGNSNKVSSKSKLNHVVFWNTMDSPEASMMSELLREFKDQHPEIHVTVKQIPFYKAREKFKQSCKAGVGPDIMRTDRFWIPDFIKQKLIVPISKKEFAKELKDLLPIAKSVIEYENKYWAMPLSVDCLALFYNKKHLKNSGLSVPTNYDEFALAAKKLTTATSGRYGFFIHPNAWYFEPMLFGFGGNYFSPDGKLILNSSYSQKALDYLLLLKNELKAVPPISIRTNSYSTMMNSFKSGQVSMIFNGPWAIKSILSKGVFKGANSNNLGITTVPRGPHGMYSPTGCQTIVISKKSKQIKSATTFIKFLCSPKIQSRLAKANYGMPARKSVFDDPDLKRDPFLKTFIHQLKMNKQIKVHPRRGDIYAPFGKKLKQVLNGDLTPKYALSDFEKEWNSKH